MYFPIIVAFSLIAAQALEKDWRLTSADQHARDYVDAASIQRTGDKVSADTLSVYNPRQPSMTAAGAYFAVEFDCKVAQMRTLKSSEFRNRGSRVEEFPLQTDPARVDTFSEKSPSAALRRFLCFGQGGEGKVRQPFDDAMLAFGVTR